MNRLVRSTLVVAVTAVVGYAVLGSGLDRMSRDDPAIAGMVPVSFRAAAWRSGNAQDIVFKRYAAAQEKARRAIVADPIDAGSSSALGVAQLNLRQGKSAEKSFRVAGQLGWRDMTTQLYWLAVATDSGALAIAAERADALLRQNRELREQPGLLAPLEASEGGRRALATRLALHPEWSGDYWNKLYLLDRTQLVGRAMVLDQPALRPPVLRCAEVRTMIAALAEKHEGARSRSVGDRFCAQAGGAMLADGGFEAAQLANSTSPGWQFAGEGGLDIRLENNRSGGGKAVVVASTLPQRRVFASQTLQLTAGHYRITWRTTGHAPGIAVRLTCQQGVGAFLVAAPSHDDRTVFDAQVGAECSTQWLELAVDPGVGPIAVDDVMLVRRGQAGP